MTTLFNATPFSASWKTAVFGHALDEAVRRPSQVVYSAVPSAEMFSSLPEEGGVFVLTVIELEVNGGIILAKRRVDRFVCCTWMLYYKMGIRHWNIHSTHIYIYKGAYPVDEVAHGGINRMVRTRLVLGSREPRSDGFTIRTSTKRSHWRKQTRTYEHE